MATFEIQAPDGKTYRIEGADQQGALSALQQHLGAQGSASPQAAPAPSQPGAPSAGSGVSLPSQPDAAPATAAPAPMAQPNAATDAGVSADRMAQFTPEQQAFINEIYAQPEAAPLQQNAINLGQTIKENIFGDNDPTTFNTGEKIGQMLNNAGESLTFGLVGDEATAAASAALGGNYDQTLERARNSQEQFREQHGGLSLASDVAPALIPGMGAAKALQGATTMGRAATGAALGGAGGATYGFMEGEGGVESRAENAAVVGTLGTVFGAAAPKVMDALASVPSRLKAAFTRSTRSPTIETLEATRNAAYDAVDQAGIRFDADTMTNLSRRVQDIFSESNMDEVADTASGAVLRILRGKEGQEQTIGQLDRVRQNLWTRYANAKDQPQILDAIRAIDGVIDEHPDASELMTVARAAHATLAKTRLLENAFTRATDGAASTGSGGNIANKYLQAVNRILGNQRELRFFNGDEVAAMRQFVRMNETGGPALRRLVGKMSPSGNGLMMTLHAVGGMASGGATLPLMVAGAVAKNSADNAVTRAGTQLRDAFAGAGPLPLQQTNALSAPAGAAVSGAVPVLENAQQDLRNALAPLPR